MSSHPYFYRSHSHLLSVHFSVCVYIYRIGKYPLMCSIQNLPSYSSLSLLINYHWFYFMCHSWVCSPYHVNSLYFNPEFILMEISAVTSPPGDCDHLRKETIAWWMHQKDHWMNKLLDVNTINESMKMKMRITTLSFSHMLQLALAHFNHHVYTFKSLWNPLILFEFEDLF